MLRRAAAALAVRLYALIVRLYPRAFREQCGAAMLRTFEELSRRERATRLTGELLDALACIVTSRRRDPASGQHEPRAARDGRLAAAALDVRYAIRRLRAQPTLVAFSVITLGFAIAASASLFSIVDAVLLRPSPFRDADRLVSVRSVTPNGFTVDGLSAMKLKQWRTEDSVFEVVEAYMPTSVVAAAGVDPEEVSAAEISPGLLRTLGVAPRHGRLFEDADGAASQVVIVSEHYWRTRLGQDPGAVGRNITVNGKPHTVAGVMPRRFHFPTMREDIWLPLDPKTGASGGRGVAKTLVRLRAGLTIATATARVAAITARLKAEQPTPGGWAIALGSHAFDGPDEQTRRAVLVLFGAVGLVLLTAGANVANLLLTRAVDRHREFAIRLMLGASRARLVRELLVEGLLLGLLAGTLGLVAAGWSVETLVRLAPNDLLLATRTGIGVDGRVIAFGFVLAMLTGVLCNLPPAFRTMRAPGRDTISGRTRTAATTPAQRRFRAALVMGEVALAVVLLIGAALMTRAFVRLNAIDVGFQPAQVLAVTVGLDAERYESETAQFALLDRVARDVEALPGVEAVAIASGVPPSAGTLSFATLETESGLCAGEPEAIVANLVSPPYFSVMGIRLADGRPLRADDPPDAVVVSRSLARRCGAESLAGRRLRLGPNAAWLRVVGTTVDVRTLGLRQEGELAVYLSWHAGTAPFPNMATMMARSVIPRRLVIRRQHAPELVAGVKRALAAHDPDQPVLSAVPATELMAGTIKRERFVLMLMALFAGVALALASAGIFGVLAYAVAQRANEIGIRVALGASAMHVIRLVVGQGAVVAAAGVAAGAALAFAGSRVLSSLLHDIDPHDPFVFIAIPALVFLVALAASWIPAARALRVDPATSLRVD
ncbi:MAG: ADOP family duplicated permease [Acidobacteriota bacterium]|nr:ADOP family duplicated permease [Acidobacteriota bacterium]